MVRKYSTLRTRFVQSKLVTKTNFFKAPVKNPARMPGQISGQPASSLEPIADLVAVDSPARLVGSEFNAGQSASVLSTRLNETLPTTMETLRSHVNYLLSLPLPVGERNRLLLDEAQASGVGLGEDGVDLSCFDLTAFGLPGFDWADVF